MPDIDLEALDIDQSRRLPEEFCEFFRFGREDAPGFHGSAEASVMLRVSPARSGAAVPWSLPAPGSGILVGRP